MNKRNKLISIFKKILLLILLLSIFMICLVYYLGKNYKEDYSVSWIFKSNLKKVHLSLISFKNDCGQFPSTSQGLEVLLISQKEPICRNLKSGNYLNAIPNNFQGENLQYEKVENSFLIYFNFYDEKKSNHRFQINEKGIITKDILNK